MSASDVALCSWYHLSNRCISSSNDDCAMTKKKQHVMAVASFNQFWSDGRPNLTIRLCQCIARWAALVQILIIELMDSAFFKGSFLQRMVAFITFVSCDVCTSSLLQICNLQSPKKTCSKTISTETCFFPDDARVLSYTSWWWLYLFRNWINLNCA